MAENEDQEGEEQCPYLAVASALALLLRNSAARVEQLLVRVCVFVPVAVLALDAGE